MDNDRVNDSTEASQNRVAMRLPPTSWAPLTTQNVADFDAVMGERGGCAGCWCMLWRTSAREWKAGQSGGNRIAMHARVKQGAIPGILLYVHGEAIGWCSVEPRDAFPGLARSRVLRPLDERRVWSVTCLFVKRPWRRRGVSVALIRAAADYVRSRGGGTLEAYPLTPKKRSIPDAFAWTGLLSAFMQAGFREAGNHVDGRPMVRRTVRRSR